MFVWYIKGWSFFMFVWYIKGWSYFMFVWSRDDHSLCSFGISRGDHSLCSFGTPSGDHSLCSFGISRGNHNVFFERIELRQKSIEQVNQGVTDPTDTNSCSMSREKVIAMIVSISLLIPYTHLKKWLKFDCPIFTFILPLIFLVLENNQKRLLLELKMCFLPHFTYYSYFIVVLSTPCLSSIYKFT
jgi:hypothetical protein